MTPKKNTSDLNYIWKDRVSKSGVRFRQRYRKRIKEEEKEEGSLGGDSKYSAAFKDKIAYGVYYKDNFYDTHGHRIQMTPEQRKIALSKYHVTSNVLNPYSHTDKETKKQLFDKIDELDSLFEKELAKRKKEYEEGQTAEASIKRVKSYMNVGSKLDSFTFKEVRAHLESVGRFFNEDIDPVIQFTVRKDGNKIYETTYDQLIEGLKNREEISRKDKNAPSGPQMTSMTIKDLDHFDENDFKQVPYKPNFEDIYKKIDKRAK